MNATELEALYRQKERFAMSKLIGFIIMFNIIYFAAAFGLNIKDDAVRANLAGQCAIAASILVNVL